MRLDSSSMKLGEPVIVHVKLKNISGKEQEITIQTKLPNFEAGISKENAGAETGSQAPVMKLKVLHLPQSQKVTRNIPAHGEYNEQIALQGAVICSEYGYARYVIREPGRYRIFGSWRSPGGQRVSAREIQLTIHK